MNKYSMECGEDTAASSALELSESGLLSRMRAVCNRYENVVRVLNEIIHLYIAEVGSNSSKSRCADLLGPIKHYDPRLFELVEGLECVPTVNSQSYFVSKNRLPAPTTLSGERVTHTEVIPPTLSPSMDGLGAIIRSISNQNQALLEKWNILSKASFDYVCIRLYKLKGTMTLGTRDRVPAPGVFITVNSLVNSTLAPDGDWCGETMTVPWSDSKGVQIDLRLETGTVIAQSAAIKAEELYMDMKEIPLGDAWSISVGIVLGFSPSSVIPQVDINS